MSEPVKCPVCGKQAKTGSSIDCARHMFGVGDKPHRAWVEAQGLSFIDLLIEQATTPGNKSYLILAEVIEKAQGKQAERKNQGEFITGTGGLHDH